jgi:hypothetical protein
VRPGRVSGLIPTRVAVSSRYMFITEREADRVTVLSLDDDLKAVTAVAAPSPVGVAVCLNESIVALSSLSEYLRFVDIRAASPADWRTGAVYRHVEGTRKTVLFVDLVETEGRLFAMGADGQ